MVKLIESSFIANTDRVACGMLNTLLHREGIEQTLKLRTMTDLCDRHGKEVEEYQEEQARKVLQRNGFDPETGLPQNGTTLPGGILRPLAGRIRVSDDRIAHLIQDVNEKREGKAQIPEGFEKAYDVEFPEDAVVEVSLDGVLSKRQKAHRSKTGQSTQENTQTNAGSKKRPAVETSVAHIQANGEWYILTAHDMRSLCIRVLAFLLHHGLLSNRQLIVFTDGAVEIKACVDEVFAFCRHRVVLDWFHLRKRCYELLSMILKSGKSNRNMRHDIMKSLMRILWVGNVPAAIQFLSELSPSCVKSEEKRQELIRYLQRKETVIPCYAIRARLGLRISSNCVEKANDLTVAKRQKHQGMGWSYHGSWHFAALTALYLNSEAETWHSSASLSFAMHPLSSLKPAASATPAA